MKIRRLEPHEIALHREVRLRALRDTPDSFRDTAAEAEAQPSPYWEELTRSVTEPGRHVMFLACDGEDIHGSTYGLRDPEDHRSGRVGGMWISPSHRQQGIGRALLHAVVSWAGEQGFGRLRLWAPGANVAALAFYQHAGFIETGHRGTLRANSRLETVELERFLLVR